MNSISTPLIKPRIQVLTEDQKEVLFLSALEILDRTGVRVDNKEGFELLSGAGARVDKHNRVRMAVILVRIIPITISVKPSILTC